uniref:Uncharacterized protein n=1 Tax=Amphimedon queenslandica TaxID=400682 RepID=A0A1X7TJB2_AMPQE
TSCVLVQSIYCKHSSSDSSIEVVDILIGVDAADCQMRNLIECLCKFLSEEYPVSVKNLCLKFILIILTSIDNISQNVMLEYFMLNSIFEALVSTFFHPDAREHHGYDAAVALALQYSSSHEEPKSLIGAVTSWKYYDMMPAEAPPAKVRISEALLLVLYEAVYLNKHFHSVLTHTRSVSTPSTPTSPSPAVHKDLPVPSSPTSTDVASIVPMAAQPMNLLGTFITFTSIIIQNIKDFKMTVPNEYPASHVHPGPFVPRPSLQFITNYLVVDCLRSITTDSCPVCNKRALPTDPKDIINDEGHPQYVYRIYCGHL